MAARIFNRKQALEKEIKELYVKCTFGVGVAATASIATTTPIVLTSAALGAARNTQTVTLQVLAAAANPGATVLVAFTGTAAAITITVTPNDGTNNTATPVTVTTANLVELINTGLITGKTPTITDASSRRVLQTATGGDTTPLADAGEGDGLIGTFSGGTTATITNNSPTGVESVARTSDGLYTITLQDAYYSCKAIKGIIKHSAAVDLRIQASAETVSSTKIVTLRLLTGAVATEPPNASVLFLKLELKNSSAV